MEERWRNADFVLGCERHIGTDKKAVVDNIAVIRDAWEGGTGELTLLLWGIQLCPT